MTLHTLLFLPPEVKPTKRTEPIEPIEPATPTDLRETVSTPLGSIPIEPEQPSPGVPVEPATPTEGPQPKEEAEVREIAAFSPALCSQFSLAKKAGASTLRVGDVEVDGKYTVDELKKKIYGLDMLSTMVSDLPLA